LLHCPVPYEMPHTVQEPSSIRAADLNKTKFFVNDGLLEPSEISSLRASDPALPLDELRRRYHDDGYLFLKGLLPRSDVLKAREEYFKFLSPTGVLQPGTSPVEGIYDSVKDVAQFPGIGSGAAGMNGHPGEVAAEFVDLALRAHGEEWYTEDFCKHPLLLEFVARFTGWAEHTIAFRRTLLRNNIPGTKAIGVHYDQIFLRHGEPTSVTAWVPMGDISLTGGGLIYLENGLANLMRPPS
jgi:phytanoyl-CoA hydroxylase